MDFAIAHLGELCDRVADGKHVVVVQRPGKAPIAIVSATELSSLAETVHVLGSESTVRALLQAEDQLDRGEGRTMTVADLGQWLAEQGLPLAEGDLCDES